MRTQSFEKLAHHLKSGHVYRREDLLAFSKAIDRDLSKLRHHGLEKVGAGLYYYPAQSRFGRLPPKDTDLVKAFLRGDSFLLFSWNHYNSLGVGLSQLYNRMVVYNHKRHGEFVLDGKTFDFRRPARGFPSKLSSEYLLVDLLNNLNQLEEDTDKVRQMVGKKLPKLQSKKVLQLAKRYGKVSTRRFLCEQYHG
ncbi:MAG: hypothetical protein AAGB12_14910 [Pseudomonadota bacterium]